MLVGQNLDIYLFEVDGNYTKSIQNEKPINKSLNQIEENFLRNIFRAIETKL
jgi:hypothetical protein